MERMGRAFKAAVPSASYLFKKLPTWKLTVRGWDEDEFRSQTKELFAQLNIHYAWLQEKIVYEEEEAYQAFLSERKDKIRDRVEEILINENALTIVEYLNPIVERVQSQSKKIRKEKSVPEDLASDVASVVYAADLFSIPAFQRFKHQLSFKYGEKYIHKVCDKKKGVDEELVSKFEFEPEKQVIRARAKEYIAKFKIREKEEALAKLDTGSASSSDEEPQKKKKKHSKAGKLKRHSDSSIDISNSDDHDDHDEEEERKKRKSNKREKNQKHATDLEMVSTEDLRSSRKKSSEIVEKEEEEVEDVEDVEVTNKVEQSEREKEDESESKKDNLAEPKDESKTPEKSNTPPSLSEADIPKPIDQESQSALDPLVSADSVNEVSVTED